MTLRWTDKATFTCDSCGDEAIMPLFGGHPEGWHQVAVYVGAAREKANRYELCRQCIEVVWWALPSKPGTLIDDRVRAAVTNGDG